MSPQAKDNPAGPAPAAAGGGPLAGVVVLDMSRVLAGPWATQFLGDLGAEVIKVERPGVGDDTRGWGPPFMPADAECPDRRGDAAYFQCANRNKKSVAIDFSKPAGADAVRRIAQRADILVENFKVGDLKRRGLDYSAVSAVNPRIVYCSITGFGQTGPHAARAGYDFMIQAMSGLMSVTGQPDGAPGGEPMKVGVAVSDLFAGLYAAASILAALRWAERTGEGQHIDVALFDCQLAALANQASNYLVSGVPPGRLGNAHPNIAPYEAVRAADAPFILAVGNDGQFRAFCRLIGAPTLADDPRFATNAARVGARAALREAIAQPLQARTAADWLALFAEAGVPAGPVNTVEQAFADPQVAARGLLAGAAADAGGDVPPLSRHPVKYSRTAPGLPSAPPKLGANTDTVLSEYLSRDEIEALRKADAIR